MNELSNLFLGVNNGETVTLEKDRIYHVRQDDSVTLDGYFCSNTAKQHENPNGVRYTAIYLKEKKNITIDGNGATLIIHGKMTPLLFDRCENITVKNIAIDYARPTMTEFTVLSNNDGVCDLRFNSDCRHSVEGNVVYFLGEDDADGKPFWKYRPDVQGMYVKVHNPEIHQSRDFNRDDLAFEKAEEIDEHTVRVTLKNKAADYIEGHVFQIRNIVRDQTGSFFERCRNLHFENLRMKFMHGLGVVSQYCENVTFLNCDFTPAEGRTIASTADFFQFSGCRGNILIDSCKANGAQDDYINVHGTHLRIVEAHKEEKSITVRFMHPETWGFQAYEKGDELEFIKWDTLIPYAVAKVVSFEKLNDTDIKLVLDKDLPEIEVEKDVVENATWTPNLTVRNCDFEQTAGRGVLCTTRGEVIIENNRFVNLWGPALLLEDDCNFWFESGYTKSITFRNNLVENCEYAEMWEGSPSIRCTPKVMNESSDAPVHAKLVIENNVFRGARMNKHLLWLEYIGEVILRNNIFDAEYDIHAHHVGKIIKEDNINSTK